VFPEGHLTEVNGEGQRTEQTQSMPVIFVGHGNPMNAIEDNEFSHAWRTLGESLPRPDAILCISAHWQARGSYVTAMQEPRTIHDFYGFPRELNEVIYPAPGSPQWAAGVRDAVHFTQIELTKEWGLDHGTWSVLCRMFPKADVPVIQLSLDYTRPPEFHYQLGKALQPLRSQGVLIIGSGNMVHNLRIMEWGDQAFEWAQRFDHRLAELILNRDHQTLIDYDLLGEDARLAIPTNEHYLPLLYTLALQGEEENVRFFAEKVTLGSISMRGLVIS
jgi:4,5-DOPA dioxygenase extradiol